MMLVVDGLDMFIEMQNSTHHHNEKYKNQNVCNVFYIISNSVDM